MRFALILVVLLLTLSACTSEKFVVWDVEHKPVFPTSHYSKLIGYFEANVVEGGVDELKNAKALILAGVTGNFTEEEIDRIVDFVKGGGKLVVLIHVPPRNLEPLLSKFGVNASLTPYEVMEVAAVPGEENVLTEGVKEIYMRGVFLVDGDLFVLKKERVVVFGGVSKKGVAKLVKFGKGEVLVFGDDAMFLNSYITRADNLKLAKNIAKWIN